MQLKFLSSPVNLFICRSPINGPKLEEEWAEFLTLAPGSDRIPVELFQILKDDAVESAAPNTQYALNM